jgi:hypothetical protein
MSKAKFYHGQRFREKSSGRCITVREVTDRGFKYELYLGDQYHAYPARMGPSLVTGGEVYVDTIEQYYGTFALLYEEIGANVENKLVSVVLTMTNGIDSYGQEV